MRHARSQRTHRPVAIVGVLVVAALAGSSFAGVPARAAPVIAVPVPARSVVPYTIEDGALQGVACPSDKTCGTAGYAFDSRFDNLRPFVGSSTGARWAIGEVSVPRASERDRAGVLSAIACPSRAKAIGKLEAVSCRSATNCVTVGGWVNPVAERYDGTSWSIVLVGIASSGVALGQ